MERPKKRAERNDDDTRTLTMVSVAVLQIDNELNRVQKVQAGTR